MQLDRIQLLEDIENKLNTNDKRTVHHNYNFMVGSDKITIYGISIDDKGLPNVKYAIVLSMDTNFKVWHKEEGFPLQGWNIFQNVNSYHILTKFFK